MGDATTQHRGSRKHILDWVRSHAFRSELNALIAPSGVTVRSEDGVMPTGAKDATGEQEARLERFLPDAAMREELQRWWLAARAGANTPNWDLAALGVRGENRAVVLVEAKANVREMSPAGKTRPVGKDGRPASANSWRNHSRIGQGIAAAEAGLNELVPGFSLSRDSHYQLSNRLAFAWKLASMGMPTVLLYLGFSNDRGIDLERPMLRDEAHWREVFWEHAKRVMPREAVDRWLNLGSAGIYIRLVSRPALEDSSPPPTR